MARPPWRTSSSLVLSLATVLLVANVCASLTLGDDLTADYLRRDGMHGHGHHDPPLLVLNETDVTMYHAPTPESYYTIDWESAGEGTRHPGLIVTHVILMCLAFFVALPISIALRSAKHAGRTIAAVAFYALCALGCATSTLYRKLTPNMYEGAVHGRHGYIVILLAISLSTIDILALFRRIFLFCRGGEKVTTKTFWNVAILGRDHGERVISGSEYRGLVNGEPEEFEEQTVLSPVRESPDLARVEAYSDNTAQWANDVRRQPSHGFERHHSRHQSTVSDGTLYGNPSSIHSFEKLQEVTGAPRLLLAHRLRRISYTVFERFLVFAGLAQLLTGIVTYTGGCRENYVNGCLAHLIKGGIFWSYGLFSFARFLGTFSEFGWAWNRSNGNFVSAECVECFLIFLYGATNTWMERFGANSGDPFTTKEIQHISIAVMFCFAGLIGMGIESKRIRNWLSAATFASVASHHMEPAANAEPASYVASFNPFPALVIGVTGAAMAAHAQRYLFQVQIHQLWGNLLVGSSVLRCFTYFFLWLGPPRSILPSRPPTEALSSFFLACGGLVFMFSTEEVTIAAMRRSRDDVMMFLNVAVAITCLAFCWTLFVVSFKGWLKSRNSSDVTCRAA